MQRSVPHRARAAGRVGPVRHLLLLVCLALMPSVAGAASYAIQLAMSDHPPRPESLPDLAVLRDYRLYVTRAENNGRSWYRLRLGFFTTVAEARRVNARLGGAFPGSWVLEVSSGERRDAAANVLGVAEAGRGDTATTPAGQGDAPAAVKEATDDPEALMEEARQAVARGEYARAIRIYTRVLQIPNTPHRPDAQEFLGLARERNGQLARAKAEYEAYLARYPDGPGADRVRQRLAGLVTARQAPKEKITGDEPQARPMRWRGGGNLSQFYRRDVQRIEGAGEVVAQSALVTDLDMFARGRGEHLDVRTRFNGGYSYDFRSGGENLTRLSTLYAHAGHRPLGISARLGRQTRGSDGVFERFDGLFLSYDTGPFGDLNLVGGYPVESSTSTSVDTEKVFYGVSGDLGPLPDAWHAGVYAIQQDAGALIDRRAVGGELRYFDEIRSLLALIDYDVHFRKLNILSVLGNWTFGETTYNLAVHLNRSPFLTASNALAGQGVTRVEDLLATFSEVQIEDLAVDRTAISRSVTAGLSHHLHEKLQLNTDFTLSSLSATPASGGVPATEGTGNEYLYSLQLIGNSLLRRGDLAIVGVIFSDASATRTATLTLDTRYPVNHLFHLNPRLRVDKREFKQDGSTQWRTAPSIRIDYRQGRNVNLEADVGAEWTERELAAGTEETSGYFLNIGYNLRF